MTPTALPPWCNTVDPGLGPDVREVLDLDPESSVETRCVGPDGRTWHSAALMPQYIPTYGAVIEVRGFRGFYQVLSVCRPGGGPPSGHPRVEVAVYRIPEGVAPVRSRLMVVESDCPPAQKPEAIAFEHLWPMFVLFVEVGKMHRRRAVVDPHCLGICLADEVPGVGDVVCVPDLSGVFRILDWEVDEKPFGDGISAPSIELWGERAAQ